MEEWSQHRTPKTTGAIDPGVKTNKADGMTVGLQEYAFGVFLLAGAEEFPEQTSGVVLFRVSFRGRGGTHRQGRAEAGMTAAGGRVATAAAHAHCLVVPALEGRHPVPKAGVAALD